VDGSAGTSNNPAEKPLGAASSRDCSLPGLPLRGESSIRRRRVPEFCKPALDPTQPDSSTSDSLPLSSEPSPPQPSPSTHRQPLAPVDPEGSRSPDGLPDATPAAQSLETFKTELKRIAELPQSHQQDKLLADLCDGISKVPEDDRHVAFDLALQVAVRLPEVGQYPSLESLAYNFGVLPEAARTERFDHVLKAIEGSPSGQAKLLKVLANSIDKLPEADRATRFQRIFDIVPRFRDEACAWLLATLCSCIKTLPKEAQSKAIESVITGVERLSNYVLGRPLEVIDDYRGALTEVQLERVLKLARQHREV
jgi:hypothetical protein